MLKRTIIIFTSGGILLVAADKIAHGDIGAGIKHLQDAVKIASTERDTGAVLDHYTGESRWASRWRPGIEWHYEIRDTGDALDTGGMVTDTA